MHKKIMQRAASALSKDAKKYASKAKNEKGVKKKHEQVEEHEAKSAAKDLKVRAKKSHEY